MGDEVVYDDGRAILDSEGVTLRRYYFPTGATKHIPYRKIREVRARLRPPGGGSTIDTKPVGR